MDNNGSHMAGSRTYKKDAGENANHSTALCVSRSHLLQLFICVGGFLRLLFKMYLYIYPVSCFQSFYMKALRQ